MNWNPDLLKFRKNIFDHWSATDMMHTGTLSIKENPQYFINFTGQESNQSKDIIAWVVISKLLVVHKDGSYEDEENSTDYMAMHVYENNVKGAKLLEDRNCFIRSVYSPEQTVMLYLHLDKAKHFNVANVLNLVLDQSNRHKDLFYNIKVFASEAFETGRAGLGYKHKQQIQVQSMLGGGVPSSHTFYKNPQFMLQVDRQ
jgi:hypothetical protein